MKFVIFAKAFISESFLISKHFVSEGNFPKIPSWPKVLQNVVKSLKRFLLQGSLSSFYSYMQSVFVILGKVIASQNLVKSFVCIFGRAGSEQSPETAIWSLPKHGD